MKYVTQFRGASTFDTCLRCLFLSVVPFQAEVYDYARHHPDAGESTRRSEGAAAVESRHVVPTLCHETPLEGAVGLPFEDPLRLDALLPGGPACEGRACTPSAP